MATVLANYLRISLEDIDLDGLDKYESNSIQNQRAYLNSFIAKTPEFDGCEVIEVLDDGRTGTNFNRPGVQRLIEMARSGKVDCIIVKNLSRWGRSYLEVGDYLEQKFPEWGVRFISINDNYDSATLNGATGGIDLAFRNLIYDLYSQDLSVKVRSGKNSATKNGKIITTYPLFGYMKDPNDKHKLVVHETDSLVVKRIFALAEAGNGLAEIVRILNAESVPTKQASKHAKGFTKEWGRGDSWGGSSVKRILTNECYTGKWIWGKTRVPQIGSHNGKSVPRENWIVVPGAIPALITDEQFERVQISLENKSKKQKNTGSRNRSIFKNKVKCGDCGRGMKYWGRISRPGVFHCDMKNRSDKYDCQSGKVEESVFFDLVLALIQRQVLLAEEVKHKMKSLTKTIPNIRSEIQSIKGLVEKSKTTKMTLWEQYHAGEVSKEVYQSEVEKISAQVEAYNKRIVELETEAKLLEMSAEEENAFVERYSRQSGITELTQSVVDEFIHQIIVYSPERIEVVLNYTNEYVKIVSEDAV